MAIQFNRDAIAKMSFRDFEKTYRLKFAGKDIKKIFTDNGGKIKAEVMDKE